MANGWHKGNLITLESVNWTAANEPDSWGVTVGIRAKVQVSV